MTSKESTLGELTKYPPVPKASFNLWDEPWINVLLNNGENKTVSLWAAFEQAGEIRDISGDLPIQDVAILRLMLSIIHASTDNVFKNWKEWHNNKELPLEEIKQYKKTHYDEFYLFHPTKPFMQEADLTFYDEEKSTLSVKGVIYDYPTDKKIMRMRGESSVSEISCAEAARLLITAQSYDVCGVHTPLIGDDVTKGKAYTKMSSLAHNTVIILEGKNLLETLLCNAVPRDGVKTDYRKNTSPETDLPPWDEHRTNDDVTGPCSSLNRLSRRIRLIPSDLSLADNDNLSVIGVMISARQEIEWDDKFYFEDMSIFTYKDSDDHKAYKPLRFSKQPYKEMGSRIIGLKAYNQDDASASNQSDATDGYPDKLSNNMKFTQKYVKEDASQLLSFRTVTVQYGSMESVITSIEDDRTLISPRALIGNDSEAICDSIMDAIAKIDKVEKYYYHFLKSSEKIIYSNTSQEYPSEQLDHMKIALEQAFNQWNEHDLMFPDRDKRWDDRLIRTSYGIIDEYIRKNTKAKDLIGHFEEDKQQSICVEEAKFKRNVKKLTEGA